MADRRSHSDADPKRPPAVVFDRRECDHCGTVKRALTLWQATDIAGCGCVCHTLKHAHDTEALRIQDRRRRGLRA